MNEIIKIEQREKWNEIIKEMTDEEKFINYFVFNKISKEASLILEKDIKNAIAPKDVVFDFQGEKVRAKLTKGKTTITEIKTKEIDWDKIIKYANENNKKLYWIHYVTKKVIEQQDKILEETIENVNKELDKELIEREDWFQNNLETFIKEKIEQKATTSYDKITFSKI